MQLDDHLLRTRTSPLARAVHSAVSRGEYELAVRTCAVSPDGAEHRVTLELLCLVAHAQGRHEEALTYARRLASYRTRDQFERARSLRLLASRLADIDLRFAWIDIRRLLGRGLECANAIRDEHTAQLTLLGDFALCRGEYEFGRQLLGAAREQLERLDDEGLRAGLQAHVAVGCARDLLGRGKTGAARSHLDDARGAAHAVGDTYAELLVRGYAARVLRVAGDAAAAIAELEVALAALASAKRTGLSDWSGLALELRYYMAEAVGAAGDWGRAVAILSEVAATASDTGSREVAAEAKYLLAFSALAAGLPCAVEAVEDAAATTRRLRYADIAADIERLRATRRFQRLARSPAAQSKRLPASPTMSSE